MASKDDLMASLMMGGGGTEEDTFLTSTPDAVVPSATDPNTTTTASTTNVGSSLFGDDDDLQTDDDPPPLALPDDPPIASTTTTVTTTATATAGSLFGSNNHDSLFGDNNNKSNSLFGTDDILFPSHNHEPPVVTGPPPSAVPPPLPPVPPPAAAPPPPTFEDTATAVAVPQFEKPSILAESGLLGTAGGGDLLFGDEITADERNGSSSNILGGKGGGGGLFDDIDHEEAEQAERMRQQAAAAALAAAAAAEAEQQQQQPARQSSNVMQMDDNSQRRAIEEQERKKREELDNLYFTQSNIITDQMQSIHLGRPPVPAGGYGTHPVGSNGYPPAGAPPYQQQQPVIDEIPVKHIATGFYRDRETEPQNNDNVPPHQQQQPGFGQDNMRQQQQQSRYNQPVVGNYAAGLHNPDLSASHRPGNSVMTPPRMLINPTQPPPPITEPMYGRVTVTEPILVQSDTFFGVRQPPHWSYQIATEILPNNQNPGGIWLVRRRFRHVVALEDRLRDDCPGAILPPRPEKHATRAIEEASASQSADFAMQRAAELQVFLNELVHHPICYKSPILRLFLALQDDLGIAWAECSGNAFTRLANAGVGAAMKVSETSAASKLPWQSTPDDIGGGEDNAELLALQSAESIRMGMVQQAVPKLEGAVTLLREHAELSGATGMELSRLVKELQTSDIELAQPFDIVSAGLLRSGRRSKRLAIELAAAIHSFQHHYKMCRYEKYAFQDRKNALQRRHKERMKADQRAAQLIMHQRNMYNAGYNPNMPQNPYQPQPPPQQQYGYPYGDRVLAQEAATADLYATDVWNEADEIGQKLKSEVYRCAWNRRNEWTVSLKVIASSMKEAVTERVGIWENVQENFLKAFPEYNDNNNDGIIVPPPDVNVAAAPFNGGTVPINSTMPSL